MATDIIGGVRQVIADFVAPDLREIKGKFEALDARIDAVEKTLNARIDAVEKGLNARFDGLEQTLKASDHANMVRFDAVNQKLDVLLKFQTLETRLGNIEQRLQEKSQ
jgi:hypothetical protein